MRFVILLFLITVFISSHAQPLSSLRMKYIPMNKDTLILDTLSILPSSVIVKDGSAKKIDTSFYHIDAEHGLFIWQRKKAPELFNRNDSALVSYRVFPMLFTKSVKHKDRSQISRDATGMVNAYLYTPVDKSSAGFLKMEGLNKSGSISRGITFGNNQDVFVQSSFNLQLAGKVSDDVQILAAISDENLPIQPEGNTQQLQEFDKVFIQLSKDSSRLIVGDYELRRPDSYFMNFFKKNQGGYFTTRFRLGKQPKAPLMRIGASGAVSKGKFARNTLPVTEGNQGPYRLKGNNNEIFIIVLAGSERIFVDGRPIVRGAQEDYVIDYNTAEIAFTPRRLITKDSRVVVEFEYSEKSYSRSLIYFNDEIETAGLKVKFNVYSEQDNPNQPLLIDLDSSRQRIMKNAGDQIATAVYNTADSVPFSSDQVLYQKRDTVAASGMYSGIFIYSTNPDSAHWRVTFSNVGAGGGDYIPEVTAANGRVFKWLEPVNGVHQGSYAPVAQLITPKKQQLATLGADILFSRFLKAGVEFAASNNDINLFSDKDKANDAGYATKIFVRQTIPFSNDTGGWFLNNTANYEFANLNFKPLERYRPVEFERDWNLVTDPDQHDEHFLSFEAALANKTRGIVSYQLRSFLKGNNYSGIMNGLTANYRAAKWKIILNGSFLSTKGISLRTRYLKHLADISRSIGSFVLGVKEVTEHNQFLKLNSDTLQPNSFFFSEYYGYASTAEKAKRKVMLSYRYRTDYVPIDLKFKEATKSHDASLNLEFLANPDQQLKTTTTYRVLEVIDTARSAQAPAKTLLNRIDYTASFLKGGLTTSTYYEISTGQELKKEYSFLEVAPGQGAYTWNDYNHNGIKELDEFEIAAFSSDANFVKIVIPTTEYITTKGNQFSEVFNILPSVFIKEKDGRARFISRFSDLFSIRLDKRTSDEELLNSLNPFHRSIEDSVLISMSSGLRNTLFYNRSNPVYGADITWQKNESKSFLVNGFESRIQNSVLLNIRWNLSSLFLLTAKGENGEKQNRSEFFSARSYSIDYYRVEPRLTYQPDAALRFSSSYEYVFKKNLFIENGEITTGHHLNIDAKYSTMNTGIFSARFSWIKLAYNADENTSLAYDMLEGLKAGRNLTWSASIQRNLGSSIQLSLNYEGRKSESAPAVHIGSMQFRAYF